MSVRLKNRSLPTTISKIHIIGGCQRGRKVSFVCQDKQLRPTPSRGRETLFNWLTPYLIGANLLDAYAGTGIISFEALSRGVKSVTALENNPQYCKQIQTNALALKQQLKLIQTDSVHWLQKHSLKPFDILYLDPPFETSLLQQSLATIVPKVKPTCLICIERLAKNNASTTALPTSLQIIKEKQFGACLIQIAKINRQQ